MPRDLFGDVTNQFDGAGARSRYIVPLSLAAHALVVVLVVVAPLMAADALPILQSRITYSSYTPVVPTPPPPPPPRGTPAAPTTPVNPNAALVDAPYGFAPERPEAPVDDSLPPGVIAGPFNHGIDALAPPPPRSPDPPKTVRAMHLVTPPSRVHHVAPVYPAIAQAARVQGIVVIQATIGVDGRVIDATVLRSVPLLDVAALDAVRQWRYTPTTVNGQPIAVVMTVTVNFTLQ